MLGFVVIAVTLAPQVQAQYATALAISVMLEDWDAQAAAQRDKILAARRRCEPQQFEFSLGSDTTGRIYAWNGRRCMAYGFDGHCLGRDCGEAFHTLAGCRSAYAHCTERSRTR